MTAFSAVCKQAARVQTGSVHPLRPTPASVLSPKETVQSIDVKQTPRTSTVEFLEIIYHLMRSTD